MPCLSKSEIEDRLKEIPCNRLVHPWSDSCFFGSIDMAVACGIGSVKLFSIMHTAQLLLKVKSKKQIDYKKEIRSFFRSIAFGILYGTTFVSMNCFFRKVLGYYNYYVWVYLVPITCGMSIFLNNPQRISITNSTFLPMVFDGFYRTIIGQGMLRMTKFRETIIFMLLNGILMSRLREKSVLENHQNGVWFYYPPTLRNTYPEEDCLLERPKITQCSHNLNCTDSLKKDLIKYGTFAMLLSSAKVIALNIKTPSRIIRKLFEWKSLKLTAFAMTYIGLFKVINCYLCKTRGDSLENTFFAGAIAGVSYTFNSNHTFLFTILTALVEITAVKLKNRYEIPSFPYTEVSFILANMYLLYMRMFDKSSCPKYVYNLLNFVTLNKSEVIDQIFHSIL